MIDLTVRDLVKSFEVGNNILDGVTFEVNTGERIGIPAHEPDDVGRKSRRKDEQERCRLENLTFQFPVRHASRLPFESDARTPSRIKQDTIELPP